MSARTHLDYAATLDCVHCGLCLPACPTYQETGRETSSPRGRIHLMRAVAEGRLEMDRAFVEEMYFCLACRACESACPAGVRYGHLVETARAEIDAQRVGPWLSRGVRRWLLRGTVGSPRVLRALAAVVRAYQRGGFDRVLKRSRILRRVPGLGRALHTLPTLSDRYRPPILIPARGRRRGRVAFFSGCIMPEALAPVHEATVRVLQRNGFEVEIPPRQVCCGALQLHAGDPVGASRLRRRNRSVFRVEDLDAVILNSAGCGATLKDAGDDLAARVRDISEFLVDIGFLAPVGTLDAKVVYDDPCHLLHGQRVATQPRQLLRAIPGLRVEDLEGSSDCCGAAGIYSITHPDTSDRLLARKIEAIRKQAPDFVASGNPGCILQLRRGIEEAGLAVEVVHPVELLERSYRVAMPETAGEAGR